MLLSLCTRETQRRRCKEKVGRYCQCTRTSVNGYCLVHSSFWEAMAVRQWREVTHIHPISPARRWLPEVVPLWHGSRAVDAEGTRVGHRHRRIRRFQPGNRRCRHVVPAPDDIVGHLSGIAHHRVQYPSCRSSLNPAKPCPKSFRRDQRPTVWRPQNFKITADRIFWRVLGFLNFALGKKHSPGDWGVEKNRSRASRWCLAFGCSFKSPVEREGDWLAAGSGASAFRAA